MSAKDVIHDAVKNALIKDGWTITHDPFTIQYEGEYAYADLAAEHPIAAERNGNKIVVEVKSFLGVSTLQDFKEALGQYRLYLLLLKKVAATYKLYLAVSDTTYWGDLQRNMIQLVIHEDKIPLLIVNLESEEIAKWIN